jgi:hypothetical protein
MLASTTWLLHIHAIEQFRRSSKGKLEIAAFSSNFSGLTSTMEWRNS